MSENNSEYKKKIKDKRKEYLEHVGKRIRKMRTSKGIKVGAMAQTIGVNKSTVIRYEKGLMEIPVSVIPIITGLCDKRPSYVFMETNDLLEDCHMVVQSIDEMYEENENPFLSKRGSFSFGKIRRWLYKKKMPESLKRKSKDYGLVMLWHSRDLIESEQVAELFEKIKQNDYTKNESALSEDLTKILKNF